MPEVESKSTSDKPRAPDWAIFHLSEYLNHAQSLGDSLFLLADGLQRVEKTPEIFKVFASVSDLIGSNISDDDMANAEKRAKDAEAQRDLGFPVLASHGLFMLWSYLEVAIMDTLVAWIENSFPTFLESDLSKAKISLQEYFSLDEHDRIRHIAHSAVRASVKPDLKGIDRFEAILKLIQLDGPVPRFIKDSIHELRCLRNVLAHHGGRCDRKFLLDCPCFESKVGEPIPATLSMLKYYINITCKYVIIIICRTGYKFGVDMTKHEAEASRQEKAPPWQTPAASN